MSSQSRVSDRFIHKARLDVLSLNSGDVEIMISAEVSEISCVLRYPFRRNIAETQHCPAPPLESHSPPEVVRLNPLHQRMEDVGDKLEALWPDLVIRHEPSKSIVCDVTVPFENRWTAFENAKARKIVKYLPLIEELQRRGYRFVITAFVGALGS